MSSTGGFREPERSSVWGVATLFGVAAVILTMFFWVIPVSLSRSEQMECMKWQRWSEEYQEFYLTPAEADQCKAHNITINAPVKF